MKLSSDTVVWAAFGEETVCNCPHRNGFPWGLFHHIILLLPGRWEMHLALLSFSFQKTVFANMQMFLVSCGWGFVQEVNKHNKALICCSIKEELKRNFDQIPKSVCVCCWSRFHDCSQMSIEVKSVFTSMSPTVDNFQYEYLLFRKYFAVFFAFFVCVSFLSAAAHLQTSCHDVKCSASCSWGDF